MKKIIALALGLVMVLCAVSVFAEDAAKTEMGMLNVGKASGSRAHCRKATPICPYQAQT